MYVCLCAHSLCLVTLKVYQVTTVVYVCALKYTNAPDSVGLCWNYVWVYSLNLISLLSPLAILNMWEVVLTAAIVM